MRVSMSDIYSPSLFFDPPREVGELALAKMFMSRVSLLTLVVNRRDVKALDSIYAKRRRNPSQSMPLVPRKPRI